MHVGVILCRLEESLCCWGELANEKSVGNDTKHKTIGIIGPKKQHQGSHVVARKDLMKA